MSCGNYKFPTSKDSDAKRVAAGGKYEGFNSFEQGIGNFKQKG